MVTSFESLETVAMQRYFIFFFLQGNLVEALRLTQQLTVQQIKRTQIIATITTTAAQGSNHLSSREAVARKAVCTELEKQERYTRAPADTKKERTKVNTDKTRRKIWWMCILTLTWRALSIYDTASTEYVFINSLWLLDRFKPLFKESLWLQRICKNRGSVKLILLTQ